MATAVEPPAPVEVPRAIQGSKVVNIKIAVLCPLHSFREHPYGVRDDAEMAGLVESIKEEGGYGFGYFPPGEGRQPV